MSVRNAILGLLAQRPRHGYELRAAFEALVGGEEIWEVKPAQIYTTLARLEDGGLVTQESVDQDGGPERRIYGITRRGRGELNKWFGSGVGGEHLRDEFFIKLMLSIQDEKADPYQVIQAQRSELYQELHDLTNRRNAANPRSALAQIFLLDKLIMHLEADLKWLDLLEARLDDIRKQPIPQPELRPRGRPKKTPQND
ncbi:MAG TPA: helix-turn-helix transcriptional regulator [Anaerolineales bacterium]|nr:helix-turn-helix transcriptional regulator [Anaerolineales bacterium]